MCITNNEDFRTKSETVTIEYETLQGDNTEFTRRKDEQLNAEQSRTLHIRISFKMSDALLSQWVQEKLEQCKHTFHNPELEYW